MRRKGRQEAPVGHTPVPKSGEDKRGNCCKVARGVEPELRDRWAERWTVEHVFLDSSHKQGWGGAEAWAHGGRK